MLVDLVTGHSYLEADVKLHILSRWAQSRLPRDVERQPLQTRIARDWYHQGLRKLLKSDEHISRRKREWIEKELGELQIESELEVETTDAEAGEKG
jgi:hypothetical protein